MEYFSSVDQTFTLDPQKMTAARTGTTRSAWSDTRLLFFGGDTGHTIDEFNSSGRYADAQSDDGWRLLQRHPSRQRQDPGSPSRRRRPLCAGRNGSGDSVHSVRRSVGSGQHRVAAQRADRDRTFRRQKILVAGGENAQHQPMLQIATFNPARIWTDKDDYQPDDPVYSVRSGWKASEDVYLYAVDSETEQWTYGGTATAGSAGILRR